MTLALADFDRISGASAAAGRSETVRALRRDRPARGRRQRAGRQAARRGRALSRPTRSTVTGRTLGAEAALASKRPGRRSSGRPVDPIKKTGGLVILHGSLAPEGAVVKLSGTERRLAPRPGARVRQRRSDVRSRPTAGDPARRRRRSFATKDRAVDRACARCWPSRPPSMGAGLGDHVALVTDGRFSGATRGLMAGHVVAGSVAWRPARRWSGTATSSIIDIAAPRSISRCRESELQTRHGGLGRRRRRDTRAACSASTRGWSRRRRSERSRVEKTGLDLSIGCEVCNCQESIMGICH